MNNKNTELKYLHCYRLDGKMRYDEYDTREIAMFQRNRIDKGHITFIEKKKSKQKKSLSNSGWN